MVHKLWDKHSRASAYSRLKPLTLQRNTDKKIYMFRLQTPQQESKLQRVRSFVYLRGLIERVHTYEYFTASFNACSGSEIQSAARDGEIHTCDMGNSLAEMTVLENIQLWIRNQGFGGAYTVRNYRGIYKIKDIVNRFLIKNKTYYFKWSISNIIKKQIFNK